jgi:mercuric reductase
VNEAREKVRKASEQMCACEKEDRSFDLVVVGGGSAGFAAAIRGAELGARVALVNDGLLGGTCVNVGCIPSKTLIRTAEAYHRRTHHGFVGVPSGDGAPDWSAVREQKDRLVADLRHTKYEDVLDAYEGITLIESRARLGADGSVALADGTVLSGAKVIVTTGSSPWTAPIPGLAEAGFLDSTAVMNLPSLPSSLLVIGGGYVGLELGQMFARLGVQVTLLVRGPRVLRREDPAIGSALAEYLRAEGVDVRTGVAVERVDRDGVYRVQIVEGGERRTLTADELLVATGRRPNTRGLGLEEAGITLGERGEVVVDEHLRTTARGVYAAGDVTGEPMYVYVAAYAGRVAAENALAGDKERYDLTAVPRVTFTDPAAAAVGLTEEGARAQGLEPVASVLSLEHVPRALAAHDTRGFIKLVADARTRRILGAHILAPEAGELITEPTLAIRFGLTIDDLTSTFHPYLTLSEGIKLAAQAFDKDVAKLSCCAA